MLSPTSTPMPNPKLSGRGNYHEFEPWQNNRRCRARYGVRSTGLTYALCSRSS